MQISFFMSETQVFSFPDGGSSNNGLMGILASAFQNRGLDPNLLFAMNNRGNNDGFGEGGWFMWVIFLFFLMGWGGNGWGGFGNRGGQGEGNFLAGQLANDTGRELLMSAIQGNGTAISQLASTLNCDVNAIQTALQGLSTQLCNIGNQVGMSGQQVINAIERGNCQLGNQLAQCCCGIQDAITRGNYENQISNLNQTNQLTSSINFVNSSVERGFAATNYAFADQTCQLKNEIAGLKQYVGDQFCNLEKREMQREIAQLRDERTQFQTSALLQQQSQNLINTLRPCPIPSYQTCNPWGCNGGFVGNGYTFAGYPYNTDGGCGACNG